MPNDSFIHACAGGVGGMIAMTSTYPLLTISMRAAVDASKKKEETLLASARKIIAKEGIKGLYAGLDSSLIGIGVTNFVYYYFFERCRDAILKSKQKVAAASATIVAAGVLTTAESMLAGLIAGVATSILSNPIWVINTRQAVRAEVPRDSAEGSSSSRNKPGSYAAAAGGSAKKAVVVRKMGFLATMQHIVRTDGVLALWRGIGPALVLVINPILQYTAFEQLKNWVVKSRLARAPAGTKNVALNDVDFFVLGALSKLVATSITYPQIVIKSRQQSGVNEKGKSNNVWTAMTDVVQHEGIAGLYRGISSKLLQSVLTAAILFMSKERVFDLTKKALSPAVAAAGSVKV
ncbi:mitochondrial carrier [Tilletiaria anomala UBC 951]|uniref:Mitochondrial carrier n=1 Tax=Tilletiaria anomala (strain ATCC 24038 / CBS 436.72 / UBC 951) TaxID=1037660 RepID=A0A066W6V4_TILAU|nr:mitochondrial carrier [Tilletiaria anomala UBC 951]KDN46799.1 mitochondrial carrier [Tilletiaria anomala UBC 951]